MGPRLRRRAQLAMAPSATKEGSPRAAETPAERAAARWIIGLGLLITALLVVRAFLLEPLQVDSDSMAPTLRPGSLIIVEKLTYRYGAPHRGDIVTTKDPRNDLDVVKRVVAVERDWVGIEDGALVLNGHAVVEGATIDNTGMEGFFFGPDLVPEGHVFLLGDNRYTSSDSRAFGPIKVHALAGRVLFEN